MSAREPRYGVTSLGTGIWSDLQAPTEFQYVEFTRMLTVGTRIGMGVLLFQAPISEFEKIRLSSTRS
jgi:hypothetical protein